MVILRYMQIVFLVVMFVLGAAMGSFLACQSWRYHLWDQKKKSPGKWSVCMRCKQRLKWYDNVPIVSWVMLRGKCRYCGKKIGTAEILAEVLMALSFLGVGIFADFSQHESLAWWGNLALLLTLIISLGFLAIYDGMWGELPVFGLIISGVIALAIFVIRIVSGFEMIQIWDTVGGIAILGGLYLVLYLASKGKWVGDGDWILGAILALSLGSSWLSLIVLFLANFLGTVVMYPMVKNKKSHKIYFGPFLVIGFVIALVFSEQFLALLG